MVDLDDALLAEAAEILGTTTKRGRCRRGRFVELKGC
ncbi:hypothetical protein ACFQ8S_20770 [Streptomyces virginiae]